MVWPVGQLLAEQTRIQTAEPREGKQYQNQHVRSYLGAAQTTHRL